MRSFQIRKIFRSQEVDQTKQDIQQQNRYEIQNETIAVSNFTFEKDRKISLAKKHQNVF